MSAKRTDANHAAMMNAMRSVGWSVVDTHDSDGRLLDFIAVQGSSVRFIEVKDGSKPSSARKLTANERAFIKEHRAVCFVIDCLDDVVRLALGNINALEKKREEYLSL